MFAGRPRQALRILNQRLSDAVERAAADASCGEALGGGRLPGLDAGSRCRGSVCMLLATPTAATVAERVTSSCPAWFCSR